MKFPNWAATVIVRALNLSSLPAVAGSALAEKKKMRVEIISSGLGFNANREPPFLLRSEDADLVLRSELMTQVSEDVGLVKHNNFYEIVDGHVVDPESGLKLVDICQGEEEIRWMEMIEKGLVRGKNVLHVRSKRLKGEVDCFDFWREEEGKVSWVRMEVVSDSKVLMGQSMRLSAISLEPMETEMRLTEVLSAFELAKKRSELTFEMIKTVVDGLFVRFKGRFGDSLLTDPELIKRFYSAVHAELDQRRQDLILVRNWVDGLDGRMIRYAEAPMEMKQRRSFGCAGSTMVGVFGQTYRVVEMGGKTRVVRENPRVGDKYCAECGCYFQGKECPLCRRG